MGTLKKLEISVTALVYFYFNFYFLHELFYIWQSVPTILLDLDNLNVLWPLSDGVSHIFDKNAWQGWNPRSDRNLSTRNIAHTTVCHRWDFAILWLIVLGHYGNPSRHQWQIGEEPFARNWRLPEPPGQQIDSWHWKISQSHSPRKWNSRTTDKRNNLHWLVSSMHFHRFENISKSRISRIYPRQCVSVRLKNKKF